MASDWATAKIKSVLTKQWRRRRESNPVDMDILRGYLSGQQHQRKRRLADASKVNFLHTQTSNWLSYSRLSISQII